MAEKASELEPVKAKTEPQLTVQRQAMIEEEITASGPLNNTSINDEDESRPFDEESGSKSMVLDVRKHHHRPWSVGVTSGFEWVRWTINRVLLFRPFFFFSFFVPGKIPFDPLKYVYDCTVADLIFFVVVAIFFIQNCLQFVAKDAKGKYGNSLGTSTDLFFAFTWIFALRNTVWNLLFGLSVERMLVYHKILPFFAVPVAFFHGWLEAPEMYRRRLTSERENDSTSFDAGKNLTGWLFTYAALAAIVFAFWMIRRLWFSEFLALHYVFFLFAYVCAALHGVTFLHIAFALFCLDWLFRVLRVFGQPVTVKRVEALPANVVRIEFEKSHFTYEAGQYVFVWIPAVGLFESHPFSLSTCPEDETVMVHVRVLGNWTERLYGLATSGNQDWSKLQMFVEGPYGNCTVEWRKYKRVLLLSGGIGITPMQSIFNQMLHDVKRGRCNLVQIVFVWTVREPTMVDEFGRRHWAGVHHDFKQTVPDIEADNDLANGVFIHPHQHALPKFFSPDLLLISQGKRKVRQTEVISKFHLTRVCNADEQQELSIEFPFLQFSRPDIEGLIKDIARSRFEEDTCTCNSAVLCCGPRSMVDDVRKLTAKYRVACHSEIFEF